MDQRESPWDRVFRDVQESRERNGSLPDPRQYENLTKAAGSRDPRPYGAQHPILRFLKRWGGHPIPDQRSSSGS